MIRPECVSCSCCSKREVCVCDLAEGTEYDTVCNLTHQLRILKQNKLVKSRREGKSVFYSLADDHVRTIVDQEEHIEEDLQHKKLM